MEKITTTVRKGGQKITGAKDMTKKEPTKATDKGGK